MPTAREILLDAALSALATLPWTSVRMVDVASAAGVSRQTLHNEFGGKDGLARALVRDAVDGYLAGVEKALGSVGGTEDKLAATAAWTVRAVRTNVLVRALLTGCWSEWLPRLGPPAAWCAPPVPGLRSAGPGPPTPAELLRRARERAVAVLGAERSPRDLEALAVTCEIALRLALSYALVPGPSGVEGETAPLVRHVVERAPDEVARRAVSGTSPRAGARLPR
ncbi:TetR/AcrR family transcriptional regulator [Streptomyces sp. NBC_01591]|uniref:TetR/AcrR family transcriptional regulator n=1 Tax=Streptomyces sp. NBC_01591 TaxID=2975888 RepID=UPI002DD8F36E|nr:TetR/AcrR family transcriptional regulator [Streptomyces sp. NBC_01591]WSD70754.1 TetR/AcrR family transcriptional regulator [Streptomyces sp. NBC_01591]